MDGQSTNKPGGFSAPAFGRILMDPAIGEVGGQGVGGGGGAEASTPSNDAPRGGEMIASQAGGREDLYNAGSTGAAGGGSGVVDAGTRPTPADPNLAAAGGATPQTAAQWQSIRDAARGYGFDLSQFQDDATALQHLVHQANANRQADYYAQLGRQLAPQYKQIQGYLAQQGQQAQVAAAPARQAWEAPAFDERWLGLVQQDPGTGVYVAKPGVDPAVAAAVNEYADWNQKFSRNPAAMIQPMVESRATEIARKMVQEELAKQGQQATIGQIATENSAWLYATDQAGQRVLDHTGRYALSPVGARYVHHLQALAQGGVRDPRMQDTLAKQLVQGEWAVQQQQAAATAAGQAANPQTQQAGGRPNLNPLQANPPAERRLNPAATEPTTAGQSLSDLLRQGFKQEGVTDADFAFSD